MGEWPSTTEMLILLFVIIGLPCFLIGLVIGLL
jgi:hypothetical protein